MQAFYLDTTDSTNDEAKRLLQAGKIRESAYVLAREQTAGRGSRGRPWASPRDAGIYLSVVEPSGNRGLGPSADFTLAAGVACAEVLHDSTGLDVRIKPVNDLWYDGRKLGGILTETAVADGFVESLITGVGINVFRAERAIRRGGARAVSLEEILPADRLEGLDFDRLTASLVARIHLWARRVLDGQADVVHREWNRLRIAGAQPVAGC